MSDIKKYFGFYPDKPVWIHNEINKKEISNFGSIGAVLAKKEFQYETNNFEIVGCRDGLFLIHLKFSGCTVGTYLDYLNAFYIVLESAQSQYSFGKYFGLKEITIEDYIYHEYEDGKILNYRLEGVNIRSKYLYSARFLSGYIPVDFGKIDTSNQFWSGLLSHTITNDPRTASRKNRVIALETFNQSCKNFERLAKSYEYVRLLAQLIKAVEEMNLGNYEQVVSYSWLIIEEYLYKLYYTNKSKYGQVMGDENISSLEVINGLRGMKVLPYEIVGELHELRKIRNQIIHSQFKNVTMAQAQLSIEVIREFIKRDTAVDIRLMF